MGSSADVLDPLHEAKRARGRLAYRVFAASVFLGVCSIWVYRASNIPSGGGGGGEKNKEPRWAGLGLFGAEVCFGLYWILTQALRWNPVYYTTFKDRLSQRYENDLPCVDIFICTADPVVEPPLLVINTVLSVMALDYPQEKLSVFLSDDGCSILTFHALLEVVDFSKHWIPFCKKFKIEPRSPAAYFSTISKARHLQANKELMAIKNLYDEMEKRIKTVCRTGYIPEEIIKKHKGFSEWSLEMKCANDHRAIVEMLIDRRHPNYVDQEGYALPALVYLSREKRPYHPHNFKAGAMNALIRVSSALSNAPIILNLDCDMYSNNSETLRDALCLFMDESGHDIGYVQFPQNFHNFTKNNLYGDSIKVVNEVEIPGMNGYGGPCYMGTGCFHRRDSISGEKFNKDHDGHWYSKTDSKVSSVKETRSMLEDRAKIYASCTYEKKTQWGKQMGLLYGCPVEDIVTGISIQGKGWRSIFLNPARKGFVGIAPITLSQMLVQHKRWSEGMFQTFISKYCPFIYGYGKIKLPLQMAYSVYCLWAPLSFSYLYYVVIPSLYLLKGISLFPQVSSLWFIPFAYVILATYIQSLVEALWSGETLRSWWNMQRTWVMRRTTSYLFGFIDALLRQIGLSKTTFVITAKVADEEVLKRYEKEIMDFGPSSPMFTLLGAIALFQLPCLGDAINKVMSKNGVEILDELFLQFLLCGMMVLINLPVYEGLFFRRDSGRMPTSVTVKSVGLAAIACSLSIL